MTQNALSTLASPPLHLARGNSGAQEPYLIQIQKASWTSSYTQLRLMKIDGQDFAKGLSVSFLVVGDTNHNNVEKSNLDGQISNRTQ